MARGVGIEVGTPLGAWNTCNTCALIERSHGHHAPSTLHLDPASPRRWHQLAPRDSVDICIDVMMLHHVA